MKKLILIVFSLVIYVNLYSQIDVKLFYNGVWALCKEADADFYRKATWDTLNNNFEKTFTDYTINDEIISTGEYLKGSKEGLFKYYYTNGNIKCIGKFENNQLDSVWTWYYDNNLVKQKIVFKNDEFNIIEFNDSSGMDRIDSNRFDWTLKLFNGPNELPLLIKGVYLNSKKDGNWELYNGDQIIGYDFYKNGKYKRTKLENGKKHNQKLIPNDLLIPYSTFAAEYMFVGKYVSQDEYPYFKFLAKWKEIEGTGVLGNSSISELDLNPRYLGGMKKICKVIAASLKIPKLSIDKTSNGKVYAEITISEEGKIINRASLNDSNDSLRMAAFEAIDHLDDFKPAIYNGMPIKSKFVITIEFTDKTM